MRGKSLIALKLMKMMKSRFYNKINRRKILKEK